MSEQDVTVNFDGFSAPAKMAGMSGSQNQVLVLQNMSLGMCPAGVMYAQG